MLFQVTFGEELLSARVARKLALLVIALVQPQLVGGLEAFGAFSAFVPLFIRMTLQMAFQAAVADEMFSTLNALEGPFSGVLPHVHFKVELARKDF